MGGTYVLVLSVSNAGESGGSDGTGSESIPESPNENGTEAEAETGLGPETEIDVGALGSIAFDSGRYAYVGSAFGPGGFARVDRHREMARGDREKRHWHVDYVLGHPGVSLEMIARFPDDDRECHLAEALPGEPVSGVGASDCDCPAHLLAIDDGVGFLAALEDEGGRLESVA
ncbi:GIY-YIG nuclease family protein [Halomontanus rarus]|uniref:GIY-YIG nuclease family protein n=1 Tax=Halomontanus rarus TaxID=3034020 RepID=UPI0023E84F4E|nr:DUF123 domain-containing protein [Halovivax sp. TS33]